MRASAAMVSGLVAAAWQHIQTRSMLRSLAEYSLLIPAAKRRQLLHGVPYYGRWWRTESDAMGPAAYGDEGPVTDSAARADLDAGRDAGPDGAAGGGGCATPCGAPFCWLGWLLVLVARRRRCSRRPMRRGE